MTAQCWLPVVELNGRYSVSDQGHIRSEPHIAIRSNGHPYTVRGRILKPLVNPRSRYPYIKVGRRNYKVHHLVASAFIGQRPDGLWVLHRNDIRTDNRADNLYYGTPSENGHDAASNGLNAMKNRTHCPATHPYNEVNTRWYRGHRYCRECGRAATRRWAAANRRVAA